LSEITWSVLRRQRLSQAFELTLSGGQRLAHSEEARYHTLNIAIDRRDRLAECYGRYCSSRVGSNAGQFLQLCFAARKATTVVAAHELRALVQVARA
jgi:hypothetical protein